MSNASTTDRYQKKGALVEFTRALFFSIFEILNVVTLLKRKRNKVQKNVTKVQKSAKKFKVFKIVCLTIWTKTKKCDKKVSQCDVFKTKT